MSSQTSRSTLTVALVATASLSITALWTDGAPVFGAQPHAQPGGPFAERIEELEERVAELEQGRLEALERISDLEETLACARMEEREINGLLGPHLIIEGCNVHVRSSTGMTETTNGLGNLIVRYNELDVVGDRPGSHNLIVGRDHSYSSYGGFVAGERNSVTSPWATVSGGYQNEAGGEAASVTGGRFNDATANWASVSGGFGNEASGESSSVCGGEFNDATGSSTTVSGGHSNNASGLWASVSGGYDNEASGLSSSVLGGYQEDAAGWDETIPPIP